MHHSGGDAAEDVERFQEALHECTESAGAIEETIIVHLHRLEY